MLAQYFEFVMKSIEKNPRQSRLVITCFMARLKLVKGRGIELHQVVQSSCHILSDIKIADFILRKDLALTSLYSFPQNQALYNVWMFHRAWKEINLSGLKVVLETNQLYISWGVKSMFLDPGVRSWIWSGEKQNMVQLKLAHNSKQLLGLEPRSWKKSQGSFVSCFI